MTHEILFHVLDFIKNICEGTHPLIQWVLEAPLLG